MKKNKILGFVIAMAGVILIIKTIPLLAWYIILGLLVFCLFLYSLLLNK